MKSEYKLEPKIDHYGYMVDLIRHVGLVKEAYELIQSMRIETDLVLWGSLMEACRMCKKLEFGEKIADFLVNNGQANSRTYILPSNIYAAVENWKEVNRMRALSHPKTKEIYSTLDEHNKLLRAYGYVLQTELVLHDLDERRKSDLGLLREISSRIWVDLYSARVCTNCHTVTKLISRIIGRKLL